MRLSPAASLSAEALRFGRFAPKVKIMSTVVEIEEAIKQLPAPQLSELHQWFEEYFAEQWDARIEADAQAGKLDFLLEEAEEAHRSGKVRPFNP